MENCVQSKIREKISHINNSEEQLYMMAKQPRDNNTNSRFDTNERNTAKKEQRVERKKRNCTHSTKGGKRIVAKFEMRIQKTKNNWYDSIAIWNTWIRIHQNVYAIRSRISNHTIERINIHSLSIAHSKYTRATQHAPITIHTHKHGLQLYGEPDYSTNNDKFPLVSSLYIFFH